MGVDLYVVRNRRGEVYYATTNPADADALASEFQDLHVERQRHVLKVV